MGLAGGLALVLGMVWAAQEGWTPPPLTYSAKPVRGVVVDAATGIPLDAVIVVAQWILHEPGKGHWRRLQVIETTTDSQGKYLIPGWGPKPNPAPWTRLITADPEILFFKEGYTPYGVQNRWDRNDPVRFSEWDGKTIKLEKFTGTVDEWARELDRLQTDLSWRHEEVVDWRTIPRMALALELERLGLQKKQLKGSNISGLYLLGTTIEEVRKFLESQK